MQEDYNKYTVPILNRVGKSMLPTHGWYRELVLNYLITHNWLSKKKHSFRDNIFYKDAYQITLHERTLSITCIELPLPKGRRFLLQRQNA